MKSKYKDLINQKFGRLKVLGIDDRNTRKTYWFCECECGNIKSVRSDSLQCGAIKSCGCLKKEQNKINLISNHSHKQSGTRIYKMWQGMKSRCYKKTNLSYHNYGGRGISICDEWIEFLPFYEWAIHNGYSDNLTIERIDVNGSYCPKNCTFATIKEQCNNRTTNIKITIGNSTKTLMEWCKIFNLNYKMVYKRYTKKDRDISLDDLFKANNILKK